LEQGQLIGKKQNYGSMQYYLDWDKLKAKVDENTFRQMRREVKGKFNELYWMPAAQSDRVWKTKFDPKFRKSSGAPAQEAAPMVLLHGLASLW
jgi:hypothetical protein